MFGLVVIISMLFEWLWWRLIWLKGQVRKNRIHTSLSNSHPQNTPTPPRLISWFTSMLLFQWSPFDIRVVWPLQKNTHIPLSSSWKAFSREIVYYMSCFWSRWLNSRAWGKKIPGRNQATLVIHWDSTCTIARCGIGTGGFGGTVGGFDFQQISLFQVLFLVGKSPLPADLFKMIWTVKSSIHSKGYL